MARERTEGERRAAEQFADAVRTEAERFFDALAEEIRRNPEGLRLPPRILPLSEDSADELANAAAHSVREQRPREAYEPPPSEAEIARGWRIGRGTGTKFVRALEAYAPELIVLDTGVVVGALVGPVGTAHHSS